MGDSSFSFSPMRPAVLVVAAGRGTRLGGGLPKQYRGLGGEPVLRHTLRALLAHPLLRQVMVVIHPNDEALYRDAVGELPLLPPVQGGAERQESVLNGLEALAALDPAPTHVLIHDAARPDLPIGVIDRLIGATVSAPAAIPVLPIVDTVKRADGVEITGTEDRKTLFRAQTPQAFQFGPLLAAHRAAKGLLLTDDAAVAERAGHKVIRVPGDPALEKITTATDLIAAEARRQAPGAPPQEVFRVGTGFDVHRLVPGDGMTLCGVSIEGTLALSGHSDADVGLHTITDALLGAVASGDIGSHFPPTEPQWKGADSEIFLIEAARQVWLAGGRIENVDVTLICERPKIGPHRPAMRARIATILRLPIDRVSVKATTTERLGFPGRGEGIAAQAAVSVAFPKAVTRRS
ncbi:MAG: bifunctional 2-C-methyl-D-erythritol 4-phosphate cytidylyltransferase/2-C-methyl-D-erythritol 2,4-cyclodiphosphate synthase [Alphaproteobacteria bacterium]|nr:bifunctional 2-C-methyl-D-erythritol 4-phosphate cytidylyltransferase/2-C-methyl-D-erythritol 2,4-cyclodiphosphate synthase [Alphaproteobacteria bacterium]